MADYLHSRDIVPVTLSLLTQPQDRLMCSPDRPKVRWSTTCTWCRRGECWTHGDRGLLEGSGTAGAKSRSGSRSGARSDGHAVQDRLSTSSASVNGQGDDGARLMAPVSERELSDAHKRLQKALTSGNIVTLDAAITAGLAAGLAPEECKRARSMLSRLREERLQMLSWDELLTATKGKGKAPASKGAGKASGKTSGKATPGTHSHCDLDLCFEHAGAPVGPNPGFFAFATLALLEGAKEVLRVAPPPNRCPGLWQDYTRWVPPGRFPLLCDPGPGLIPPAELFGHSDGFSENMVLDPLGLSPIIEISGWETLMESYQDQEVIYYGESCAGEWTEHECSGQGLDLDLLRRNGDGPPLGAATAPVSWREAPTRTHTFAGRVVGVPGPASKRPMLTN